MPQKVFNLLGHFHVYLMALVVFMEFFLLLFFPTLKGPRFQVFFHI